MIKKIISLLKKKEHHSRTIIQFLFYDENEDLESISVYVDNKKEAKKYCRNVFLMNAHLLVEELVSSIEKETEIIDKELEKDNNFNYCGVKRIHVIICEGLIDGIEENVYEDVIKKLY